MSERNWKTIGTISFDRHGTFEVQVSYDQFDECPQLYLRGLPIRLLTNEYCEDDVPILLPPFVIWIHDPEAIISMMTQFKSRLQKIEEEGKHL